MNAILRHFAMRLWLAATLGSLLGFLWLPLWQRLFGLQWLWMPATATLALAFMAAGWCMNRAGRFLLQRQIREAGVWERAGMDRQAGAAYDRLSAIFDSFWLSPLARHQNDRLAAGQMVRYHLAQGELTPLGRRILAAYFQRNPRDAAAAERWLEHLLEQEHHSAAEHEAVVRVGDTLVDQAPVQRLVMRFYLASGRTDFSALQTYRRVWRQTPELAPEEIIRLARLLLAESLLNDWALAVYLKAYAAGAPECFEGIQAAVRMMRQDSANQVQLEQARAICAAIGAAPIPVTPVRQFSLAPTTPSIDHSRTERPVPIASPPHAEPRMRRRIEAEAEPAETEPVWRFNAGPPGSASDVEEIPAVLRPEGSLGVLKKACGLLGRQAAVPAGRALAAIGRRLPLGLHGTPAAFKLTFPSAGTLRKAAIAAAATAVILVMVIAGWRSWSRQPDTVAESTVASAPPVVTDPFTIQVAAYLRAEDAIRFTERLRNNGLEAYHSVATSKNRKWYQVKVSHFATRSQAREFGEQLKAKGLIEDFYVSNYQPGDTLPPP